MSRSRLVARNVLVTLATQLISWGLAFAVTLYLPRYVGVVNFGKLTFAASFAALFGVFVPLGTSTVLIKEIARDRNRTGELVLAALLSRLPLGLLMAGLAIATIFLLHRPRLDCLLVIVASAGFIIGALNDALGSALQGQENFTRSNAVALVDKFLSTTLILIMLFAFAKGTVPLWVLASAGLASGVTSLAFNAASFRSVWRTWQWPQWVTVRSLVLTGMPFFGMVLFRTIYGQADVTLLSFMTDDRTVGWYGVATRLLGSTLFLPVAIVTALLPSLTRLRTESEERYAVAVRRALGLVIVCVVPIAIPVIVLPYQIIFQLLHYPPSFFGSVPVLSIYGVGMVLWYVTQVLGTALIVQDRQSAMFRIFLVAMVLTIGGCMAAIPAAQKFLHNGAVGAAIVDVAVEIYVMVAFVRTLPRDLFSWQSGSAFVKAVSAALPLLALTFYLRNGWTIWPGAVAGIALYVFLCCRMGCVDSQDIAMFRGMIAKKQPA